MAQRNRGKQPKDDEWFASKWYPIFTEAVDDNFLYEYRPTRLLPRREDGAQ